MFKINGVQTDICNKYLFLGDTHGDIDFLERAMYLANEEGCAEVIQVGDWGFVWPGSNYTNYLMTLLERENLTMRFIDGNHDEHPYLRQYEGYPYEPRRFSDRLIYQPRGSVHVDADGTRFLFLGGAPSIDKAFRKEWWPEEEITNEEANYALFQSDAKNIDVLVTHDAAAFPPGFGPKGDAEFVRKGQRSMDIIECVVHTHSPKLHVHGHWHTRYEKDDGTTRTVGLASNLQTLDKASLVWSKT